MPEPKTHQSFTIRVPVAMYLEMGQLAQDEGSNLNKKANQLLSLGLNKHVSLDAALRALLVKTITEPEKEAAVG